MMPSTYWRTSLSPAYRGASQEQLEQLLAACRAAEPTHDPIVDRDVTPENDTSEGAT
jgi:hypothetical protein